MARSAWPSISWTLRRSAPPSSRCVANECRRRCGCTRSGSRPRLRGELAQDQERARAGERPALRVEEELRPVAAVEVRAAAREVAPHGVRGSAADGHDPLLRRPCRRRGRAARRGRRRRARGRPPRSRAGPRRRAARRARGRAAAAASSRPRPRSGARPRRARAFAAGGGCAAASARSAAGCRRARRAASGGGRASAARRGGGRSSPASPSARSCAR